MLLANRSIHYPSKVNLRLTGFTFSALFSNFNTMFQGYDIKEELQKYKLNKVNPGDFIIEEVHKILAKSLFKEQNILNNLKNYNKSFALLDEETLDRSLIFKPGELKAVCINLRLKFLDSQAYRFDVPYEAVLKIKHLNEVQKKDLDGFKIMGMAGAFRKQLPNANFALFAPTVMGNYYLVHHWGTKLKWYKKLMAFPLRNFEMLMITVISFVLIVTLCLPTYLITLDREATYWCGYRIGIFFHLLIFFSGFTAYILVGFNKRFSGTVWDKEREFT